MVSPRRPSRRISLSDLLERCGQVLGGLERRQFLLAEMRRIGGDIDHAYAAFEKGPRTMQDRSLLEETQASLQAQIERLRAEADVVMSQWWDLHSAARSGLERAAVQEPPLLPILERLGRLPLPDANSPVRQVLQLRALLLEAEGILEPAAEASMPTTPAQPQVGGLLSAQQVAAELGLSDKTVYRLAKQGRIPYVRIQSSLRFRRADLDQWLAAKSFQLPAKRPRRTPV